MSRIGIVGDTHSLYPAMELACKLFAEEGITEILQVGDFGFWPGSPGENFLSRTRRALEKHGQTLYVTPGNHEDYRQIAKFPLREDGWQVARKDSILVAPRGHRWEWEGRSFVSLGGAPSVDRAFRLQKQRMTGFPLWWKEEEVTEEDVAKTVEGGYADIMVAHDAPFGVPTIERKIAHNPNGFLEEDLAYALVGRERMLKAVSGVKPKVYFHGHYHFPVRDLLPVDGHNVEIYGMTCDGMYGTYGSLDLETLTFGYLG